MGILRSETMRHGTLVVPAARARFYVNILGHKSGMQFEDMNATSLKRNYRKFVSRIEELERMVRYLMDELEKRGERIETGSYEEFLTSADSDYRLEHVEEELTRIYQQFVKFRANNAVLLEERVAALEEQGVCNFAALVNGGGGGNWTGERVLEFNNVAGVLDATERDRFEKLIFRATRGNAFCDFADNGAAGVVFVVYYQGSVGSNMCVKIEKIATGLGGRLYAFPRERSVAESRARHLGEVVVDKNHAIGAYEKFLAGEIAHLVGVPRFGGSSLIEEWRRVCVKEKGIYMTLNLFAGESLQTLRADCWYPENQEEEIRRLLVLQQIPGQVSAMLLSDNVDTSGCTVPTYIKTNSFMGVYQEIVDTYGIPRYKEVNPAIFATVTFPFLFGVMFGDVGHGSLLLLLGIWSVTQGEALKTKFPILYYVKYLVLSMGIAAVYAGFMYSEFFSIGLNLFGSSFDCSATTGECVKAPDYGAYIFGLDPGWMESGNMLLYVNSLKMKLAVILGVAQMLLGVGLKFVNAWHFRNGIDLVCECIPQLLFLGSVFGYMDWMIMYKWTRVTANAPSLISTMINWGLPGVTVKPENQLYEGQEYIQEWLLFIAIVSVPWLLIPKPLLLYFRGGTTGHGEEHNFGELAIHQIIETIEFVLGCVSHTASYLRLWALSLAHQQLSVVFIQRILFPAMIDSYWIFNCISIYIRMAIFLTVTAAILLGVDALECFLHTLRLHWVEFQGKFYKADGVKYQPYSHLNILL